MSDNTSKKKYRIEYDRANCIGAAVCAAIAPTVWELAGDGLADCLVSEFDEQDFSMNMAAAQGCPVNVIHIVNNETGERII